MEDLVNKLKAAMTSTRELVNFIQQHHTLAYAHQNGLEHYAIESVLEIYTKAHPVANGTANDAYTSAGVIQLPTTLKLQISQLVNQANEARAEFGELYSIYNKTDGMVGRANKGLTAAVIKMPNDIPHVIRGLHISTKQIKRKIIMSDEPSRITLYQEPQKRIERVTSEKIELMLNGMSPERSAYTRDKLGTVDLKDLRIVYSNGKYRYRANIMHKVGDRSKWDNIAISMPIIVIADEPVSLRKVSDSTQRESLRTDRHEMLDFLPELNLYVGN
jgi:hypothetical protein